MGAKYTLVIDSATEDAAGFRRIFDRSNKRKSIANVITHLRALQGGIKRARVFACVSSAFASQTITCAQASAVDNTDTVTIGGTTLSVKASPATTSEFAKGASDTAMATNLKNCINAHATVSKIVFASSSEGVVTVRCKYPGPIGNLVTLAEVGDGMTLGGSVLANGASDEVDEYAFGFAG